MGAYEYRKEFYPMKKGQLAEGRIERIGYTVYSPHPVPSLRERDGKVKIRVGIGLVYQGEMPPFRGHGTKSVVCHGAAQNGAILDLLLGQPLGMLRMGQLPK